MKAVLRYAAQPQFGIAAIFAAFVLGVGAIEPRFLTMETAHLVLLAMPLILIAAMGQMMVVIARHIDLSIGSILGFAAIAAGMVFRDHPQWPLAVGCIVAVACGAGLGCVNGLLVTLLGLPSIIVTLGTLSLFRGLLFMLSDGRQIDPNHIPESLIAMTHTSAVVIPWIVLVALAITILTWLFMRHTHAGREIFAIGANPEAARLRGIRVVPLTLLVFLISGALAGLAGVVYAARFGYVNPGITGVGFEFTVIAAVVIGGVSVGGGTGSVAGTFIGVALLAAIGVALPLMGLSGFWQGAIHGAIIVLALLIDSVIRRGAMRLAPRGSSR